MLRAGTLTRLAVLAVALLGVTVSRAGQVVDATLRHEGEWLVADLQLADLLDDRTRSTVESGLPGSCLLKLELRNIKTGSQITLRLERSLEVDLWEDLVRLIESDGEQIFRSIAEADSAWSSWPSLRLARWSSLKQGHDYQLNIAVDVQPLGNEERERVSRWVSAGDRGDRRDVSIDMGGLVRRFFGSGDNNDQVEVWSSPYFRLETLGDAP